MSDYFNAIAHTAFMPYVTGYLEHLQVHHYSKLYISTVTYRFKRFVLWCDAVGIDDPKLVNRPLLERYQKHLYEYRKPDGKPLSVITQMGHLTTVRMFFKWLTQQNHILYNPAGELVMPKKPTILPVVLSQAQVQTLLSLPDTNTAKGIRDRTILELFYSTGIRRSELLHLRVKDVNLKQNTLHVRDGKGGKDRVIPIGHRASGWLSRYLLEVRETLIADKQEQHVFVNSHGKPYSHKKLGRLVKKYLTQSGYTGYGACHLLRHAMATHMLENDAELRYIQAMLGHSHIKSTQVYTHVAINKLQQVHEQTHPSNQLTDE